MIRVSRSIIFEIAWVLLAALLALASAWVALDLSNANWNVPFYYGQQGGDEFWIYLLVKNLCTTGQWYTSDRVGFPLGMVMYDFPLTEALHVALLWVMARLTDNFAFVVNTYYVAYFPMAAISASVVLRALGVSRGVVVVLALAYAVQPFVFYRGQAHLFVGGLFVVPPVCLVCVWLMQTPIRLKSWRFAIALSAMMIAAASGVYYMAFSVAFVMTAACLGVVRTEVGWRGLRIPATLCAAAVMTTFLCTLPTTLYRIENGPNAAIMVRHPYAADVYGLRVASLVLPTRGHRLDRIDVARDGYGTEFRLNYENDRTPLGLLGVMGLCVLAWQLIKCATGRPHDTRQANLALLCVAAIVVASVGGLATIFTYFVTPNIRVPARVSSYILFFCLLGVASVMDRQTMRLTARYGIAAAIAFLVSVGLIAMFDQTSPRWAPAHAKIISQWKSDADFVARIESTLPRGAAIFQYPMMTYLEGPYIGAISNYDLFRGYLHSDALKWSHGAVAGRGIEIWRRRISTNPVEALPTLRREGFAGIYYDRRAQLGEAFEAQLKSAAQGPMIVSPDGQLVFVPIGK